jgi:hypothetical protein
MGRDLNSCQLVAGVALLACLSTAVYGSSTAHVSQSTGTSGLSATGVTKRAPSALATNQASSSVAVDSCTAITQSEASAALGQAVRVPVRGKATVEGGIACVFYGPSVPAGANPDIPVSGSVRVVLVRGAQARSFFADYRTKVHAEAVPGLGDQAYYDGYASLSVLKGEAYIRIAVIGVRNILGAEKMLAVGALPRM